MPTRAYPACESSERALIGGLILDPRRLDEVSHLVSPRDFHRDDHGRLLALLTEMRGAGKSIDLVTVTEAMQREDAASSYGGVAYVVALTRDVPATANLAHYATVVREKAVLRRFIEAAEEATRKAYAQPADVPAFLSSATRDLSSIADGGAAPGWSSAADIIDAMGDDDGPAGEAVPTPWFALNQIIHGLYPTDLLVLAARPAMGKTALALNIATRHADSAPVGIFSLEMSKSQLINRILCDIGGVDAERMRKGRLHPDDYDRLDWAKRQLRRLPIHIEDTGHITLAELRSRAMGLASKVPDLGLIVVDYLQIMKGDPSIRSREQQISDISRGLKGLAKDLGLPVLALSQLNRDVEKRQDKRPMISDLRESGAIEQDADLIMFIYRDEYYNPDTTMDPGIAEVIIAKHRAGRCDTARLGFEGRYMRFTDVDGQSIALD